MQDRTEATRKRGELTAMRKRLKELEDALEDSRRSAANCREIVDNAGDSVFVHEPGGRFLEVNRAACERLGYSREELLARGPQDIDTPEFAARVLPRLQELSEHTPVLFESAHVRRDGTVIPVEIASRLITFDGRPAVLSIARDLRARKHLETDLAAAKADLERTVAERTAALRTTNSLLLAEVAERRRAEAALRESEARFRTILEEVPNLAVQGYDEKRRVTFWNAASEELYGYGRAEALGRQLEELIIPPAMREAVVAAVTDWLERGRSIPAGELTLQRKDGSAVPVHSSHVMLCDAHGRREMFCLDVDLSTREAALCKLAASEEKYRSIVETALEGIWSMDGAYRTTYVNPVMADMLGYTPEEMLGRPVTDFMFPEDLEDHQGQMAGRRQGRSGRYERRFRRKDGGELWTIVSARPRLDAEGRFAGSFGMFTDLSAYRRTLAELAASEARYRTLVDELPLSIMTFDAKGRVTYVNRWHLAHFARGRLGAEAFLGRKLTELPGVVRAGIADRLAPLLDGRPVALEGAFFPKASGGQSCYQDIIGIPVPPGQADGGMLIRQDATERKRAADALNAAKEAAEAANRSKGAFLASMSHDIRTPLHGLLGMLELLKTSGLAQEQAGFVDTALASGRSLIEIINDILDLSRVDAGRLTLTEEPFRPEEVVRRVMDNLAPQARAAGLELTAAIDPDTPEVVLGDARRLSQVLYNLVGNALKFTSQGRATVSLCAPRAGAQEGRLQLLFSVADTGEGIPPDKLAGIFEPFSRVERHGRRQADGSGLGLAIVKRLVELMGGTVAVESEPGLGTTVHFTIIAGRPAEQGLAGARDADRHAEFRSLRVLVAEDEAVNLALALRFLRDLGHQASGARDGREALEHLASGPFDLVLLDLQMPEVDGFEVCRRLAGGDAALAGARPYLVAMTAHAMTGDRERFLSLGLDDYLPKPFSRAELQAILGRACQPRRR